MPVVGEAHVIVRAITSGFEDDVRRSISGSGLSNIGQRAGQSFTSGFSRGTSAKTAKFAKDIEGARLKLQGLVTQSYFVGPAIGVAASAIGALGASAFAMGAQVSAAVPSLIVLPSIFSAMAQAMITAKLAFSGLGKAISGLGKQRKSAGVDRMPGILSALASAQERLANADKRVEKAQKSLTQSYIDAQEALDQLNFDVEDAAIAQKRAAIDLENARKTLARLQDLPPNSAARQEAELAFQEADLNYRRAIDRNKDLTEEAKKRNEAGIAGSQEVLGAEENLTDAQKEQKKAVIELAKATKALTDAKAGKGAGGSSSAPDPLEGLSKEAAAFAKYIDSLKGKTAELKAAAGKQLFGPLEDAIQNLVDNLFPRLAPILESTGKALGKSAVDFSKIVTEADNLKNLDKVAKTNSDTVGKLGTVTGNLYSIFLSLLSAADPLVRRFTDWAVALTDGWKATREAKNQSGELTKTFEYAGDVAAQLGRIFGNLGRAIFDIGTSAAGPGSGGQMLLDMLEGATVKFQAFVDKAQEGGKLDQFFRDAAVNAAAIGRLFNSIVIEVAKLGDNKEVASVADGLVPAVESLGRMFDILTGGGPALGEFVTKLIGLLEKFAETGSINVFFGILNKILDVLNLVFANDVVMKIFGVLAMVKAVMIALSLSVKVFAFYGKAILGTIAKLLGLGNATKGAAMIQKFWNAVMHNSFLQTQLLRLMYLKDAIAKKIAAGATKAWTAIQAAFNAVMAGNPIALVVLAIVALIAIIIIAYKKFGWFRDIVDAVFSAIKSVISGVWDGILIAFNAVWDVIAAAIPFVWNNVIKPIFEAFGAVWGLIWDGIRLYYETIWKIIYTGITFAWNNIIQPVFRAIGTVFSKVWDGIKGAFTGAWDFITRTIDGARTVFGKVGDAIIAAFKGAINFIIRGWNRIEFKIPGFKIGPIGYSGFTLGLPDIPELAQGGIIRPTPGGTLARIGEAGRAERVEPLDADGLSKRDKAMISLLAGGAGGGMTINVYPSPGMNEVELASLVNRQISFQLRKGAA